MPAISIVPPLSLLVVTCDLLQDPVNGDVTLPGSLAFGSVATYECDDGYMLSGEGQRMCTASGVWQPDAPTCPRKN